MYIAQNKHCSGVKHKNSESASTAPLNTIYLNKFDSIWDRVSAIRGFSVVLHRQSGGRLVIGIAWFTTAWDYL